MPAVIRPLSPASRPRGFLRASKSADGTPAGAPAPKEEGVRRSGKSKRKRGRDPLILVVDDYLDAREMYARCLTLSGFQVEQAQAGPEAVEKSVLLQPELIILDVAMPGMDGWEVIRRLKADPRTRNTMIVVVTGAAYGTSLKRAAEAGCDAYLVKPCLPDTLLGVVRRLLSQRRG